jgi:hypothetical protein
LDEESKMSIVPDNTVATRKVGAEDIIMMSLPTDRFRGIIPPHYAPPVNDTSLYQVALIAQACKSNSFDNYETGRTDEVHFWLQVASSNAGMHVKGADIMLPSMQWFALACASRNVMARNYLKKLGFSPKSLQNIYLKKHGGSLSFPDGGLINWTFTGPGKALPHVGVNHVIFVAEDKPNAIGHRVAALLSDTVMQQPGSIHIQTAALEPFLLEGERIAAVVHRMSKLEARVVWQQHPK